MNSCLSSVITLKKANGPQPWFLMLISVWTHENKRCAEEVIKVFERSNIYLKDVVYAEWIENQEQRWPSMPCEGSSFISKSFPLPWVNHPPNRLRPSFLPPIFILTEHNIYIIASKYWISHLYLHHSTPILIFFHLTSYLFIHYRLRLWTTWRIQPIYVKCWMAGCCLYELRVEWLL